MVNQNLNKVDLALFHDGKSVGVFKPCYMGMLGISLDNSDINYPEDTPLEVEIHMPGNTYFDSKRFPVVVSCVTNKRTGLRFGHGNPFQNERWKAILHKHVSA